LSYRGNQKGNYGNQKRGHVGFLGRKKKPKQPKEEDVVYFRNADPPEQKIQPETVAWQNRPLDQGVSLFLVRPTTFTVPGAKTVLPSDLTLQGKNAYEIALLSESQKLGLEAVSGDSSVRKYRILKTVDQLPTDKPLSFSDYQFIGNIKNSLRSHGYTVLPQ